MRTLQLDGFRVGVATRHLSPRDARVVQPWVDPVTGVLVAMDGRLDAATELAARLGVRDGSLTPSDAELVARAYARYGSGFAAQIHGEFAFVVYDPQERLALAARDTLGSRMVYWARTPTGVVISNELPALRRFPGVEDNLDPLAIADFLMHGYVDYFDKQRTPFASIRALPPSECLVVRDGDIRVRRYRSFGEMLHQVRGLRPSEIPDAFREAFAQALEERMEASSVLIPLSGGLDSTTIAATAKLLCDRGRTRAQLTAITNLASESDPEGAFAREVANSLGLEHRLAVIRPGTFLGDGAPTWYPQLSFFSQPHDSEAKAETPQFDITIFGSAGDSVVYQERSTWIGLLRQYGLRHAGHAWLTLRASGRSISWGTGLQSGRLRHGPGVDFDWAMPHGRPSWLVPSFVSDYRLDQRWADNLRWRPVDELHPVYPHAQAMLQWANWFGGYFDVGMECTPSEWTDPFLDFRVISLCFSLPPEPWMFRKHLLREVGSGLLPDSVLKRPKTPAGNYVAPWVRAADRRILDGWQMAPELAAFVDRDAIPPIDAETEGRNAYMNFRPLMLQRWFAGLGQW